MKIVPDFPMQSRSNGSSVDALFEEMDVGVVYELTQGEDFQCNAKSLCTAAYKYGRAYGYNARTQHRKQWPKKVWICFEGLSDDR